MIELRVDLSDAASVAKAGAILALLSGSAPLVEHAAVAETKPAKPRAKPAEKPPVEKPAEDDLLGDEPEPPAAPAATRDDAAKAIVELSKKKGRPAAVAVLEKFRPEGFPKTVKNSDGEEVPNEVKLPVIAKENYGKLVAEAKKALAAE